MIAVVGAAGTIGREVVRFLADWGEEVARCDARLDGPERVDVRDPQSLRRALADASVCVNCVDYRLNIDVMRACLDTATNYVDLGGLFHVTRTQLGLDADFRERGLTAVIGLGSAPGKTNLLARAAVDRLGSEPRTMEIWAVTRDPAAADHPLPAPYSVTTLLDELRSSPIVVDGGELHAVEPLSGRAEREFPDPIGRAEGIYTLHSELATLPFAYPTLEHAAFRLCLSPGLLDKLLALGPDEQPEPYVQSPASVAVHLVDVRNGTKGVEGMTLTRGGSARSTAEPAARAAVELAAGRLSAPGVHPPEAAIPHPEAFLARLDTELRWR